MNQTQQQIQKTENYQQFKGILGNRPVIKVGVENLKNSIKKHNMLAENPINVNEKMQIIDGQHRLEAARELGLPVYFTVIPGSGFDEMLLKNLNQRTWTEKNYLFSYISQGKKDYVELREFMGRYGLALSTSVGLLTNKMNDTKGLLDDFRLGKFEITNREYAEEFAATITRIGGTVEGNFWRSRPFIRALIIAATKVPAEELVKKITSSKTKLRSRPNIREYLRDFEEIYNRGKKKNITRLVG